MLITSQLLLCATLVLLVACLDLVLAQPQYKFLQFSQQLQQQRKYINNRFRRFPPAVAGMKLKEKLLEKLNRYRQLNTETICYDSVGCFELPHKRSPLQKVPEDPDMISTKFYLFRRDLNFSNPQILYYDDAGKSLEQSKFNYSQPLKMTIHGYMGKWTDIGNLIVARSYLKIYDCNVMIMDWSIGARGPQYATAAANSELVGRQLGILLLKMVENGLDARKIHLLGFSLGAHVAGTSSEALKKKGHLLGRITGMDAASPLFRTNHLREKHKKLDREDAVLVDVIHTDSSPSITDGFGLWEPVGHVDFFPNGGQDQPGCTDAKPSIVVSHFDRSGLTRELACSHIRAWRLFQETLTDKASANPKGCHFTAFSCPAGGLSSFEKGHCFPRLLAQNTTNNSLVRSKFRKNNNNNEIGRFGEDVKGEGVMFFVTKSTPPFCGTQLQASVYVSPNTGAVKGLLILTLQYGNDTVVNFQITCESSDFLMTGNVMSGLSTAPHNSLDPQQVKNLTLSMKFIDLEYEEENNNTFIPTIYIDKVVIRDMYSNSWQYCKRGTTLEEIHNQEPAAQSRINITLSSGKEC